MLTLVSNIRRQLLWLWVGFSLPVLLLVFVQTIAGKYTEIEMTTWIWVGTNLLPAFVILLWGAIQNRNAGKFIQTFVYRIIFLSTVAYLILLLMTLFAMTAGSSEQSLQNYLQQSYQWLLPFQMLLIAVFVLLFFKENAVFRPNEKMIKEHVAKEMKHANANNDLKQQQGFELLVANDYTQLFDHLSQSFGTAKEMESNQLIMLQTQYNDWENKTNLGLIDAKDAQLTINRISMALIQLIKKL